LEPLRKEIAACVEEEGWTKQALDKMQLLECAIKESQRLDPIVGGKPRSVVIIGRMDLTLSIAVLMQRVAEVDCTLAGVFIPSGTAVSVNLLDTQFRSAAWGDEPETFNPYRLLNKEVVEGKGRKWGITTTSPDILTFGHGKGSCPGRFFAATELKLLLAFLLHNYDIKLDAKPGEEDKRPANLWIAASCIPNPMQRVLFRKRSS